ncbi:MAG: NAD-dependent epimerase/dehydratase family protein [Thaumarchaeota archaeon]|nr:NAD-dependent epimerase/dehydratase family protein [Candidatus Geocrenenecus arthurdayi]MCL7391965.1 NAD-dependent epimerase/dehydratase family protein [Candidatus Geocrenenecus arthurdayi]MCL7396046.1 NAD-dependent epimerase/dehydratase family protein [Candidatus Geocrenenecus arthurdayi]MCL7403025.1 NAD-dependent epimerase/dehydratase family protein [Candidatus Geocrenenecus arthurdayi]
MRMLITGGAGFIGSHLVDALMSRGYEVIAIDNLARGEIENISKWMKNPRFKFVKGDVTDIDLMLSIVRECDTIFHLAANPEVRVGDPSDHFRNNLYATYIVLEAMRVNNVKKIVFTSSSTVYGEAKIIPTPEDYSPLVPISIYGACKLGSESLIIGYSKTYGFNSIILRLANIVGSRSRHGVIVDFIKKLLKDSSRLEILGDGEQMKSYLHITDCIEAIVRSSENIGEDIQIYNVGSEDAINVKTIAKIIIEELNLDDVKIEYKDEFGGRGWIGDVRRMLLDISKIKSIGWRPRYNSSEAVRLAVRELRKEIRNVS